MERIEKFLARHNIGSRQEAKRLLRKKNIYVNGQLVTKIGLQIDPQKDKVEVNGIEIAAQEQDSFILLNKPKGYITSKDDPSGLPTVFELLPAGTSKDIHAVGRLDVDSTGLLLFVTDGSLTHRLTHPKHHVEKEYQVLLQGELDNNIKQQIEKGIILDNKRTKPCTITSIEKRPGQTTLNITLTEGKHRQVRRMFGQYDLPVLALKRIRFGKILLADLAEGQARKLAQIEEDYLKTI